MIEGYITPTELREIADLCEMLEGATSDIYLGQILVSDVNGEHLGYIHPGDSGYAFYPRDEFTEE